MQIRVSNKKIIEIGILNLFTKGFSNTHTIISKDVIENRKLLLFPTNNI